ncbi:MAG: sulfatase-like hydrolase/transferase [Candidatus Aminicenantes bacterium]|nr:sulfatase-like hydrolase/transferase [Candidatus Aminicenantes bacterium]
MASTKKRRPAVLVAWAIVAAVTVAGLAIGVRYFRTPRFLRGERDRVSPILKPVDLSEHSFFLRGSRYFLRLDDGRPSLTWELDRPVQGKLHLTLYVSSKKSPEPPLEFVVNAIAPTGGSHRLYSDVLQCPPSGSDERTFETDVALPAGAKIEVEAIPDTAKDWAFLHAGISIPLIETESTAAKPSHLLIISLDALRSDYLGVYQTLDGHPPEQSFSPQLDLFSDDAVVFLNARTTQSSTWPALTSLFLSAYPIEHGTTRNGEFGGAAGGSMASLMRGLGYSTTAYLANANTINIPGFEEKRHLFGDNVLIRHARKKIAAQASKPFFHFYHLWGAHDSYRPPESVMRIIEKDNPDYRYKIFRTTDMMYRDTPCTPEEIEAVRRLYAGTVYNADSILGTLFDDLKRLGLWEDTMIIVTADHGEELYDHHQYFYHNPSLYDAALRVPLLIKFPGQRGRRVIEENVSLIDVFPTIHDYFAGPVRPGQFSGLSLIPLLKGLRKAFRERTVFAEAEDSQIAAAVKGRYKLIYNPNNIEGRNRLGLPFPFAPKELYDLSNDPHETRNLADAGISVERSLLAAADRYLRSMRPAKAKKAQENVELSEEERKETEKRLRSLGYIR